MYLFLEDYKCIQIALQSCTLLCCFGKKGQQMNLKYTDLFWPKHCAAYDDDTRVCGFIKSCVLWDETAASIVLLCIYECCCWCLLFQIEDNALDIYELWFHSRTPGGVWVHNSFSD